MLSPKFIRENLDLVKENCKKRFFNFDTDLFDQLERERLSTLTALEESRKVQNKESKLIGKLPKEDTSRQEKFKELKKLSDRIKFLEEENRKIEQKVFNFCLTVPNILAKEVPFGKDETSNLEVKKAGQKRKFEFEIKDHIDIGNSLDIFDFERSSKVFGSRFTIVKNQGAKLERALINFFIEENISAGYREINAPVIVPEKLLFGTGQLPKFEKDIFKIEAKEHPFYLIPSAEVSITNLYMDEILTEEDLPMKFTSASNCFRSEAGAAGKDSKGIFRQHQFHKIEIVSYATPQNSKQRHEEMIEHIESLLKKLDLHYRIMLLSSGDTGFSAEKCYDFEVWLPKEKAYREISSCSNCGQFQALRSKIRYKNKETKKINTFTP